MPAIREFIPPVYRLYLNRLRGLGFNRLYESYAAAAADCPGDGYSTEDLVRVVQRKTVHLRDSLVSSDRLLARHEDTRCLLAIMEARHENGSEGPVHVLDFGGACGAQYFVTKVHFPRVPFRWNVVETPDMVRMGKQIFEGEELRFHSSIDAACLESPQFDLAVSSACLQYLPDPLAGLRSLMAARARRLVLSRNGLAPGDRSLFTIQRSMLSHNGVGKLPEGIRDMKIEYPASFVKKAEFEAVIRTKYDIRMEFDEGASFQLPNITVPLVGYFCGIQQTQV